MRLNHVGIAVRSISEQLKIWQDVLGLAVKYIKEVPDQKVKVAAFELDGVEIELLEALDDQSPVRRFIEKKGEGLHHLCIQVHDIVQTLSELKARGVQLIDETPRIGASGKRIAFVHPNDMGGVLLELVQE